MKCLSRSRNLVVAVVVFLLAAASAPAALALPAGPGGGGGVGWDVQAFFDWVQGAFGGFFGGGGGEGEGVSSITGKLHNSLDPDGRDLTSSSDVSSTEEGENLDQGSMER